MSFYRQYYPGRLLNEYIECFWEFRSSPGKENPMERLIPGGRIELVFNFGTPLQWLVTPAAPSRPSPIVTQVLGQRDKLYFAKTLGIVNLFGIRFKPGGINAFTDISASELLNQMVPADTVFTFPFIEWEPRLFEAKTTLEKIQMLKSMLFKVIKPTGTDWDWVHSSVETIRTTDKPISIQNLLEEKGQYYKRLERAFLRYVGYTPKYYSRIVRFNKALREMATQQKSLTHVATDCHYYDQSHFIKDFLLFSGTTPKQFDVHDNALAGLLIRHQTI